MTSQEVKEIVQAQIVAKLHHNKSRSTCRKYTAFLRWFGFAQRRNRNVCNEIDAHLRATGVTVWCDAEQKTSVYDFKRDEYITFQLTAITHPASVAQTERKSLPQAKNDHAGTIEIAPAQSNLKLYLHQKEALSKLSKASQGKTLAGLLVLPTGGGKTLTAARWLAQHYLDRHKKVLWIAHRHELLRQAQQTFHEKLAFADVFRQRKAFNYRILSGIHDRSVNVQAKDDIIFASKDSLRDGFKYLAEKWLGNGADELFLVIDEAHHAPAKTYHQLIDTLRGQCWKLSILGLTATPFRTADSEQGLLKKVFPDDIIYKIDLQTLITRGILAEPIFEEVATQVDFTQELDDAQWEKIRHSDLDALGRETVKTIAENAPRNAFIVKHYLRHKDKYRQTLVFALNQDNAIALNKLFRDNGVNSDYVISGLQDSFLGVTVSDRANRDKIARFRRGEISVLINVNILTEGADLPQVQSVFLARPTISTILMTQMVGRGLRGQEANGTAHAYVVSFLDKWRGNIAWVNPEQLFIAENVDFNDSSRAARDYLVRLIAISKIEEFAALANRTLDVETHKQLEKLPFIERVPVGLYQFALLEKPAENAAEPSEKICEVLIYNNLRQAYQDFINSLPKLFRREGLEKKDFLTADELVKLSRQVEAKFFHGVPQYPAYEVNDLKNILQFYAANAIAPPFIEFAERSKFDLTQVAREIVAQDFRQSEKNAFISDLWRADARKWQAFFGYDENCFRSELDLALRKLEQPQLYGATSEAQPKPNDVKELRELEKLSMKELQEQFPDHWQRLFEAVFAKFTDKEGFYYSASGYFRSKRKADFEIDHIKPMKKGGLTVLENLQLLRRAENRRKGAA